MAEDARERPLALLRRDEIPYIALARRAYRRIQRDRLHDALQQRRQLLLPHSGGLRQFRATRLTPQRLLQLGPDARQPPDSVYDVGGQADIAPGVGDGAHDGLAYPVGRVGAEPKSLAPVELFGSMDEAENTFLHQVFHRQAAPLVTLRDRRDQAQIGVDEGIFRRAVALFDALRQ